jgi:hypothetical protein
VVVQKSDLEVEAGLEIESEEKVLQMEMVGLDCEKVEVSERRSMKMVCYEQEAVEEKSELDECLR